MDPGLLLKLLLRELVGLVNQDNSNMELSLLLEELHVFATLANATLLLGAIVLLVSKISN